MALFGATATGGHDLLDETGTDPTAGRALTHWTDLPPQGDGRDADTFISGYPTERFYVVQRTTLDEAAHRAGMVRTTALLFPVDYIGEVDLEAAYDVLVHPNDLRCYNVESFARPAIEGSPPGTACLAAALVHTACAAWIGTGADGAIAALWRRLSADDRLSFRFGLAFSPHNLSLPDATYTVAVVPERYAMRWQEWEQIGSECVTDDEAAEALLGGGAGPTTAMLGRPGSLREWRFVPTADELLSRFQTLDHEETRSLAQLVGHLAPAPDQGHELKSQVVRRLRALSPEATAADIRGLRLLPWYAFGEEELGELLPTWTDHVVARRTRSADVVKAVEMVVTSDEDDPFRSALADALSASLSREPDKAVPHLRSLLTSDHRKAGLHWTVRQIGAKEVDPLLADAITSPDDWLAALAKKLKMAETFVSSVQLNDPVAAWAELRALSTQGARDRLIERMAPEQLIETAVAHGDDDLLRSAAAVVVKRPELMPTDLQDDGTHNLLAAVTIQGHNPWQVVPAEVAAPALLERVSTGAEVEAHLLTALADSPAANIAAIPRREVIWKRLDTGIRKKFLVATAPTVAENLDANGPLPEPELQCELLSDSVLGPLAHDAPGQALLIIARLPGARQNHAVLVAQRARLNAAQARALGDLIVGRRWKGAVLDIARMAEQRSDLSPTVKRALELLGLVERLMLPAKLLASGPPPTRTDLRDALQEIVIDLYPKGPDEDHLWERAGGKPADLPNAKTPRAQWRSALRMVADGAGGAPSSGELVETMRSDFPSNEQLAKLECLMEKG